MEKVLLTIVLAPLAAAILAGLCGRWIGRAGAHTVTILGVAVAFVLSAMVLFDLANGGVPTVLVEKEPQLGGFAAKLKSRFPAAPNHTEPAQDGLARKFLEAVYSPKIQVLTSARVVKTEGQPGMFDVSIEREGAVSVERVGAIVLVAGQSPVITIGAAFAMGLIGSLIAAVVGAVVLLFVLRLIKKA